MTESTIATALHEATSHLHADPGLTGRVRRGGRRRLHRQRAALTIGAVAVVAAIVPAAVALVPAGAHHQTISIAGVPHDLQPARSCDGMASDGGGPAAPSAYPQLLMLPPGQPVTYAFANTGGAPRCAYFPHVALTLLHITNGVVTEGIEVDGPNAPSALQDGYGGAQWSFSGQTWHRQVDGHPATVYYLAGVRTANVFWSGSDGDQWHAVFRGLREPALDVVLDRLAVDPRTGTATLPTTTTRGWVIAPAAPDPTGKDAGVFYALWHDGPSRLALWVAQGPDRVDQDAAQMFDAHLVTVNGRPGVVGRPGDTNLRWQVGDDTEAYLTMTHSTEAEIEQVAASIEPISPTDPRLHRPS